MIEEKEKEWWKRGRRAEKRKEKIRKVNETYLSSLSSIPSQVLAWREGEGTSQAFHSTW